MAVSARLSVEPKMLEWACDRSGKSRDDLRTKFPKLDDWLAQDIEPTTNQLRAFAKATYTPFGQLFMREPPDDSLQIPDFRAGRQAANTPSPHLRDTISDCRLRQLWYRDYLNDNGEEPLDLVGAIGGRASPANVTAMFTAETGFGLEQRQTAKTWSHALRDITHHLRTLGFLVFISGVARSDVHRPLDPGEFRGFALSDPLAPLIFINGRDAKAAQMFTIAHEVAHVLRGQSGLDDIPELRESPSSEERWCDAVAAELLVPSSDLSVRFSPDSESVNEVQRLARHYKVSRLVILRRLLDAGLMDRDGYRDLYAAFRAQYEQRERGADTGSDSGGDFYATFFARNGREYASAVIASTLDGKTSYTEMSSLLGIKSIKTFDRIARDVGLAT